MTENPNNNANYFDPRQGHGNRLATIKVVANVPRLARIQQGSVGRSAPGCQTRLHLQDPADGVGEVATTGRSPLNIIFFIYYVTLTCLKKMIGAEHGVV